MKGLDDGEWLSDASHARFEELLRAYSPERVLEAVRRQFAGLPRSMAKKLSGSAESVELLNFVAYCVENLNLADLDERDMLMRAWQRSIDINCFRVNVVADAERSVAFFTCCEIVCICARELESRDSKEGMQ